MKSTHWILIGCAAAVGLWYYFKQKQTAEIDDEEEEENEDEARYSSDAAFDTGGDPGLSREAQVATLIDALDHAQRSQMAASTGAYQTILDQADEVDTDTLTYAQRSQIAASQRGSAVIRAQAISTAAPVKAPATKSTASTAAKMPSMKNTHAPTAAQVAAIKKAQRKSKSKKRPIANALAQLGKMTSALSAGQAFVKPNTTGALSTVNAATTAANMSVTKSFGF